MAAYGFNNVVPARGGDVVKLFLTKTSIPNSSYPAIGSSFFVEAIFDLCMAIPILTFAFTQGAFPKPPDFSKLPGVRHRVLRLQPAVHAVPADRARDRVARRLRAPVGARAGVLGARAPGPGDPARPPPLLPRGLPRPARRLGAALHGVLVPARGVQRRRLGQERPARARRQRRRGLRPVHPRRRRRPAGAAGQGLLGHRRRRDGGELLGRPADRDRGRSRSRSASPRSCSSSASAPSRRSSRRAASRAGRRRGRARSPGPRAPRARASRPRGTPSPSRSGSAAPAAPWCPGC